MLCNSNCSFLTCLILLVVFFLLKTKVILIVPVNTLISPVCTKEQWYPSSMVNFKLGSKVQSLM